MGSINLLPTTLRPKDYVVRLSTSLRKLALICLILLLFSILVAVGSFLILSFQLRDSVAKQSRLKNEIIAQEGTEQKLVLVQDRLGKVASLLNLENANAEAQIFSDVLAKVPPEVSIDSVKLTSSRADIVIFTTSSLYLTRFLSELVVSDFKKVELLSFSYQGTKGGYEVEFGISR